MRMGKGHPAVPPSHRAHACVTMYDTESCREFTRRVAQREHRGFVVLQIGGLVERVMVVDKCE